MSFFKRKPKDLTITFVVPANVIQKLRNDRVLYYKHNRTTDQMISDALMAHLSAEIISYFQIHSETLKDERQEIINSEKE